MRLKFIQPILTVFGLLTAGVTGVAQGKVDKPTAQPELEVGGLFSTTTAPPFWLRANQYGIVPLTAPLGTIRAAFRRDYAPVDSSAGRSRRFRWGFGIQPVVNVGVVNQVLLPEAYTKIRYGAVEVYAGRRREVVGLGDTTLTSGFLMGSGNALPVPKVQINTLGYASLPFWGRFLAVNAGFAHGWYNVPYIRGAYLHQKYLYLRFGKPQARLKVHAGLNHQVQWGGQADYLKAFPGLATDGRLPSSFKDFQYVLFAFAPSETGSQNLAYFESYRVGNHLGSHDFGVEVNAGGGNLLCYYQHPYEDVSGLLFINFPDGLWGLRWRNNTPKDGSPTLNVQHLTVEHLTTLDQSGATFMVPGSRYQGMDNYFNHAQYRQGWSYFGRGIGTPFIAPIADLRPAVQQQSGFFFPNNRVSIWYVGARGLLLNRIGLTVRAAYSRNYGTFGSGYNPPVDQVSALLGTDVPLARWPGVSVRAQVALDGEGLYPAAVGGFLSLRKTW